VKNDFVRAFQVLPTIAEENHTIGNSEEDESIIHSGQKDLEPRHVSALGGRNSIACTVYDLRINCFTRYHRIKHRIYLLIVTPT